MDNTLDEILMATKEMFALIDEGETSTSKQDEELFQRYYDLFQAKNLSYKIKTPISISFLKANKELFSINVLEFQIPFKIGVHGTLILIFSIIKK